jgi:uncharacterized DUF497 family protein
MRDAFWEWHDDKAELNLRRHHVSFEDAQQAFNDPYSLDIYDEDHSTVDERRFIRLGLTPKGVLFVSYTLRNDRTHIIHARKASKALEKEYEKYRGQ